ncbi:Cro/CI family transcriptional regulator [Paludibacterium denitrificans]|uniref:Uncharacterized protein n=1 Tax=Paludibacterium denitrificans TaxID=2675226 RepID=A0A844GBD5_9NEIS|nr:hypothetical protein [Paludibacterium denitrificans]
MKKDRVVSHFGGVAKTAAALMVSGPAVRQWPDDLPFAAIGRIAVLQPEAWSLLCEEESNGTTGCALGALTDREND